MVEDNPPVAYCIYCGEPVWPGQEATIVSKTSLDESGEPDFASHSIQGIAHPDCWDRMRPDVPESQPETRH